MVCARAYTPAHAVASYAAVPLPCMRRGRRCSPAPAPAPLVRPSGASLKCKKARAAGPRECDSARSEFGVRGSEGEVSDVGLLPTFAMDELIPGVPDIFREVDVLLEDWLIDAKMTPEEDWQQVS